MPETEQNSLEMRAECRLLSWHHPTRWKARCWLVALPPRATAAAPLKTCLDHVFPFAGKPPFRKLNILQYFTRVLLLSLCTLRWHIVLGRNGKNWMSLIYILNNAFRSWIIPPSLSVQNSVTSCHPTSKLNGCTDFPLVLISFRWLGLGLGLNEFLGKSFRKSLGRSGSFKTNW